MTSKETARVADELPSMEEFTIRKPLFRVVALVFSLGVSGGVVIDLMHGYYWATALDVLTLAVLLGVVLAVRYGGVGRSPAVAALTYAGALNFVLAIGQAFFMTGGPPLEAMVYDNLFVLALFMGVASFLVGRSSSLVFGTLILAVLVTASFLWNIEWIRGNLWYEVPAVAGAAFLLHQYRGSLDRLLAELHRVILENKSLRDRERLAELGQMTAGIAHEIKNPLNFVVNFAESSQELLGDLETLLSKPQLSDDEREERTYLFRELRQNLDDIRAQGLRGAATVQGMLLQSRSGTGEFQAVDLNELAGECLQLAWLGHRETLARRRFEAWPQPAMVKGSRSDLTRAFLNLCTNALWSVLERARKEGSDYWPEVVVSVSVAESEVAVTVKDNGLGFSSQTKSQLFVPFFTTKPAGDGTGLGLVLTREVIVDQHGGRLEVDGEPGVGARFRVVLPLLGVAG